MSEIVHIVAVLEARPTLWRWEIRTEDGAFLAGFASAESALWWIAQTTGGRYRARHGAASIEVTVPSVEALRYALERAAGRPWPLRHSE